MTGPLVQLQAAGTRREPNEAATRQRSQDICTDKQHSVHKPTRTAQQHARQISAGEGVSQTSECLPDVRKGFMPLDWPAQAAHMLRAAALLKSPASGTHATHKKVSRLRE